MSTQHTDTVREFSLLKIYLVVASLIGLVGFIIGYGMVAYQTVYRMVITDDEYLASNNAWEITQCDNTAPTVRADTIEQAPPDYAISDQRIAACKDKAKVTAIARRDYQYKESLVGGSVWGTVFLFLFLAHFPLFLRRSRVMGA